MTPRDRVAMAAAHLTLAYREEMSHPQRGELAVALIRLHPCCDTYNITNDDIRAKLNMIYDGIPAEREQQ